MHVTLLPPSKEACPICATKHEPDQAHNAQSLYYHYRFHARYGRWPTWADAVAHCSPEMKAAWTQRIKDRGVWTECDGEPIAEPLESATHEGVDVTNLVKATDLEEK